jgi:cyclohexyl-isocyanide hydratase
LHAAENAAPAHVHPPQLRMGSEQIAILVYPEFTALDALEPHYPLAGMMGASVRFVAKTLDPVPCEGASQGGFCVKPHLTFATCPAQLDLLLVPGGVKGTIAAIQDEATRQFLTDRGARAKLVGSVCTGSLLLGEYDPHPPFPAGGQSRHGGQTGGGHAQHHARTAH